MRYKIRNLTRVNNSFLTNLDERRPEGLWENEEDAIFYPKTDAKEVRTELYLRYYRIINERLIIERE